MVKLAGQLVTIRKINYGLFREKGNNTPYYLLEEDDSYSWWVDSFFIEEEASNEIKESYDKLFERSDANV